ncbi:MAG: hypothetical protein D6772_05020 [Bacteroidetes bacterium]|nr:MAG: hypothetical protein D6772_05020 [Bacteroidota bacterium]
MEGRLIVFYEFKALSLVKTQQLLPQIDPTELTEGLTLSEITINKLVLPNRNRCSQSGLRSVARPGILRTQ